jgi:putative acetyltransferase
MTERPYEPRDLPRVIDTYTASIRSLASQFYSPEQLAAWAPIAQDEARWRDRLAALHTIVIEADGLIAGFASYTDNGYLDFIFTHPNFARRGIATKLYHRVEAALIAAGVSMVTSHVSLAARAFFERQGFQVDAEETVECRGTHLRRFAMHKSLY